jgi:hypothetical protein
MCLSLTSAGQNKESTGRSLVLGIDEQTNSARDAMGKINLEDLKPGMVLSASVLERGGRVLLGPGVEITERHIEIFRKWGVTEADVENVTQEDVVAMSTAQLDPHILEEAEKFTGKLFRVADLKMPAVNELHRLATLRRVRKLAKGGGA